MLRLFFSITLLFLAVTPSSFAADKQTTSRTFGEDLQALAKQYFSSTQNELLAMHLYSQTRDVIKVTNGELEHGINKIGTIEDRMAVFPGKLYPRELVATEVIPLGVDYAVTITAFTARLIDFAGNQRQQQGGITLVWEKAKGEWRIVHVHESTK
jgi:calcium/calmodulin dependent protein kinase II association protein